MSVVKNSNHIANKLIFLIFLTVLSLQLSAANRALIVGVSEYKNPRFNLQGIDYDVGMAEKMAKILSFQQSEIMIITGKNATKTNIKHAFENWLTKGVGQDDRVFFYFSGHGGRVADKNNDESDQQDEFITTYDLGGSVKGGGYIIDDELAIWLDSIPSQNKLVMLDSCNSGTATKALPLNGGQMGAVTLSSKLFVLSQDNDNIVMANGNQTNSKALKSLENSSFIDGKKGILTLAAARDYEQAQASGKGSLFTLGMMQALQNAAQNGTKPTAQELVDSAGIYIKNKLSQDLDKLHQPVVFGDSQKANSPLFVKASRNSQGPNWQELKALAKSGQAMQASSAKSQYSNGQVITFNIDVPINGYLNVMNVDAHDVVTVIFPNKYVQDNRIKSGLIKFPNDLLPFEIEATEPNGDSLTVFVITSERINLYKENVDVRNASGEFNQDFASMGESNYRGMQVRARETHNLMYTTGVKTSVK